MNRIVRLFIHLWFAFFSILGGFVGYIVLTLPDVSTLDSVNPETTSFIEYRKDRHYDTEGFRLTIKQSWVDLDEIPRLLQRTVVISEDAGFYIHEGIDWHEVQAAWEKNLEEGKVVRGASTITQQTAKNLYLTPKRNFIRKFKEYFITQDLEKSLTKKRILELYLNYIEFGKGIFGLASASRHYFNKNPSELSIDEMVRLTAIIPSPLRLNPNQPNGELRWRCNEILRRLYHYKSISFDEYDETRNHFRKFFSNV